MHRADVQIGATYTARMGGREIHVRIERSAFAGRGWVATNLSSGREVGIRSGRRLHALVEASPSQQLSEEPVDEARYELVDAPNGQRLPRWVVGAMLGPMKGGPA